ncbi:MAG: GntR family transcriptional regulator [Defluviitaleaceae bacterium]|nr:GntR family transcriptional regulator [Defluviitaleaceae bacterium]
MEKVCKELDVPLYVQLAHIIRKMIESGELAEGSYLMPERDLCELQEISRMTVNKAIGMLVTRGFLVRKQGKGTYVAQSKPISSYQSLESLSEMQKKKGMKVSNDLLSFEAISLSNWLKKKLETTSSSGYKIKRVRYLESEPLVLETIYLNETMCPQLTKHLVESRSMYDLYHRKYHHDLVRAEQIIRPILLNEAEASALKQAKDSFALKIYRCVYTEKGDVMEYTESIFLSQKHDFEIVLT